MFSRFNLVATAVALVGVVAADLQVTVPGGPDLWWVAKADNNLFWTCQQSSFQNFTVLVNNSNPQLFPGPIAILPIENNFDCSKIITQDQVNQPPGTGYTILLANPLNNTDIYAQSQPFEIKAAGSVYPASSATPTATGTSSGTSTSSGSSPSGSSSPAAHQASGASTLSVSLSGGVGAVLAVAAMGLMVMA